MAITVPTLSQADLPRAEWVWKETSGSRVKRAFFRKTFASSKGLRRATLRVAGDFADATIYLNGRKIATASSHGPLSETIVTGDLREGSNVIAVHGVATSGPAAFCVTLTLLLDGDSTRSIVSDESWLTTGSSHVGWEMPNFDARKWRTVTSFGELALQPWGDDGDRLSISAFDDYNQWKQALDSASKEARSSVSTRPGFFVKPGFEVELVRSARKDEGSWVGMTIDPQGRLLIGREDRGILRFTIPDEGEIRVETVNDSLRECRGLLYTHGALYANANESKGLYRLRDTTGDDSFDEIRLLHRSAGGGGHGRNDLAIGPDGKIYVIHGDSVEVPLDCPDATSPFRKWRPRKKSKEGHLYRIDLDGSSRELVASGLRNPYGIDFNADGELFSYDADAEFDMGSPWYRPTRVVHLVRGGDYGWRGVTKSWPPYYPDHPDNAPYNLDTGKGSPTSVKFGSKSHFPPIYQRALFILDWAYGRILAVHMKPRGASYAMSAETFLKGRPLNVTDLEFTSDGSMVFITGGRKTSSALYRVRFTGDKVSETKLTRQQRERNLVCAEARKLRRELESFHGSEDPRAVAFSWPHLASPDPWIRHAARVAIEHQAMASWKQRALSETRPRAALTVLMALARSGHVDLRSATLLRLENFSLRKLRPDAREIALRVYSLCLDHHSSLDADVLSRVATTLDAAYPGGDPATSRALGALLARIDHPSVGSRTLAKTLQLIESATRQEDLMHYLFVLRNVREGWTDERRVTYFQALRRLDDYAGGAGMPTFIQTIRSDAQEALTSGERKLIAAILAAGSPEGKPLPARDARKDFVKKWTMDDLSPALVSSSQERSFERGREMFQAALCIRCHRVGRTGSAFGPDLTSVASRFNRRDLLDSILRPSNVVAEKYRNVTVVKKDGSLAVGRLMLHRDYRLSVLRIVEDALQPNRITEIPKPDILRYEVSKTSSMPEGLLNTLSKQEVLDLLTYLESGGRKVHPLYSK